MKTKKVSESPLVVVLTNERDFAADRVIAEMLATGARVERLNVESAVSHPVCPWTTEEPPDRFVIWWRQFELDQQPVDLEHADDALVERAQWRAWLSCLDTPESRWMNPLWAARRAENKIEQLRIATKLGFNVPATIVTNSLGEAERFACANPGGTVVKTMSSAYFSFSDQSFVFTEPLEHSGLVDHQAWNQTPLIVQRRITGAHDARVISFGDHVYGARCKTAELDWRKSHHPEEAWAPWMVPPELRALCTRYRRAFGLEYAAFDFMVDGHCAWFLEANQAGEFAFLDRTLDLGIAQALAEHLIELGRD